MNPSGIYPGSIKERKCYNDGRELLFPVNRNDHFIFSTPKLEGGVIA